MVKKTLKPKKPKSKKPKAKKPKAKNNNTNTNKISININTTGKTTTAKRKNKTGATTDGVGTGGLNGSDNKNGPKTKVAGPPSKGDGYNVPPFNRISVESKPDFEGLINKALDNRSNLLIGGADNSALTDRLNRLESDTDNNKRLLTDGHEKVRKLLEFKDSGPKVEELYTPKTPAKTPVKAHVNIKTNNAKSVYTCATCNYSTDRLSNKNRHISSAIHKRKMRESNNLQNTQGVDSPIRLTPPAPIVPTVVPAEENPLDTKKPIASGDIEVFNSPPALNTRSRSKTFNAPRGLPSVPIIEKETLPFTPPSLRREPDHPPPPSPLTGNRTRSVGLASDRTPLFNSNRNSNKIYIDEEDDDEDN
jgi:hypothetical protein